jgi:signal transduction histidine kinase
MAAAHEMRTPLHAIGLHLEIVARLSSGEHESAQRKQIELAHRVLTGYVRRTSMLLDAARVTGGVFKLQVERVPLKALISSVVELYAAKAAFQGAPVNVNIAAGIIGKWDRGAVETIVANLLSNALKYGQGAPIVISGTADDNGDAIIRVADSGPGIPENQRSHMFEKFVRAVPDNAATGYGLGLWIANQLALLHGGSIVLEPTSTGAIFVVRLPLVAGD